jgi:hypothetical protein
MAQTGRLTHRYGIFRFCTIPVGLTTACAKPENPVSVGRATGLNHTGGSAVPVGIAASEFRNMELEKIFCGALLTGFRDGTQLSNQSPSSNLGLLFQSFCRPTGRRPEGSAQILSNTISPTASTQQSVQPYRRAALSTGNPHQVL